MALQLNKIKNFSLILVCMWNYLTNGCVTKDVLSLWLAAIAMAYLSLNANPRGSKYLGQQLGPPPVFCCDIVSAENGGYEAVAQGPSDGTTSSHYITISVTLSISPLDVAVEAATGMSLPKLLPILHAYVCAACFFLLRVASTQSWLLEHTFPLSLIMLYCCDDVTFQSYGQPYRLSWVPLQVSF